MLRRQELWPHALASKEALVLYPGVQPERKKPGESERLREREREREGERKRADQPPSHEASCSRTPSEVVS